MRISTDIDLEATWSALASPAAEGDDEGVHRRVDPAHPLDIYAGVRDGTKATFLLISPTQPPAFRELRSVSVEVRKRDDGRFSLLLTLQEAALRPIFARLCADLVNATRSGVSPERGPATILARLDRWWQLLEGQRFGLERSILMGLIAELLVLRDRLIPELGADLAVGSWVGPERGDQDFRLPTGLRIEVKAVWTDQHAVTINGLGQLDGQGDLVELVVVRLAETVRSTSDALTAPLLVNDLRQDLSLYPAALSEFESLLAGVGWHEHPTHDDLVVRILGAERHCVDESFPSLTPRNVATAVTDARYSLHLPPADLGRIQPVLITTAEP